MSFHSPKPKVDDEEDPLEKLMKHTGCLSLHYEVQVGKSEIYIRDPIAKLAISESFIRLFIGFIFVGMHS